MSEAQPVPVQSTSNMTSLLLQEAELKKQIADLKKSNRKNAIEQVKNLMTQYDITVEDLTKKASPVAGTKVPPKWQDPVSGAKWTGRGRTPVWFNPETAIKL